MGADIKVQSQAVHGGGSGVPIKVTTDTNIPADSPAYIVFVDATGKIVGGSSTFTNVTMKAGETTADSLDAGIPAAAVDNYVSIDRLNML